MMDIFMILSGLLLGSALYTDCLSGKIPNALTLAFACTGLCFHIFFSGLSSGGFEWVQGLAAGTGLFILPYIAGGTGGGDVKLFGALGALTGPGAVFWIFIYSALCAGIICAFKIMVNRNGDMANAALENKTIAYTGPAVLGYLIYLPAGNLF
jgi:prepilin peptidase CpaA